MSFDSIEAIARESDIVVVGKVVGSSGGEQDVYPAGTLDPGVIAFTDFVIDVAEVLKGKIDGTTVTVHQTGGVAGDTRKEVQDDPLLRVGDEYVLVLRGAGDERYFVLGGPDGRLIIQSDRVSSLSQVFPDRQIEDLGIEHTPLSDVRATVRSAP